MLTSHAKRIFSDYVTCFGKNNSCSNRSHLPQCFIKALRFLLAWLLCFYMENPRIFFLEGDIRNIPDCPGRNNSHFALENEGWNMSLVFSVWHPPWFFSFSGMVVETSNLGDVSAHNPEPRSPVGLFGFQRGRKSFTSARTWSKILRFPRCPRSARR